MGVGSSSAVVSCLGGNGGRTPRLNYNDLKPGISSEPLIKELNLDPMITPNFPYKLRCSSTL